VKNHTWLISEYLRPLVVNVDFVRNGTVLFRSVTFAGYVGVLTGLKPVRFDEGHVVAAVKAVAFCLGSRPPQGRQPFLEGQRVHILCRQLYYLCFVRVLDGVVGL